jgi:NADH:ubiquinone oxidoreductase subunit 6 (subunit J)
MPHEITFFILAGTAILAAALTVSVNKALYSIFFFSATLLATAAIFLQLYAPLLFVAQFVLIGAALAGVLIFAVEASRLDVAIVAEYPWRPRAVALLLTLVLLAEITLAVLQRRFLPGQDLALLLPAGPMGPPLSLKMVLQFFFNFGLLPVTLSAVIFLVAWAGIESVIRQKA